MATITISVNVGGPTFREITQEIIAAVRRHLRIEVQRLARDAIVVWRKATPRVSGVLRASEVAVISYRDGSVNVRFRVTFPGSAYYNKVASLKRHRALRNNKVVLKWFDSHVQQYVNAAVDAALRETA